MKLRVFLNSNDLRQFLLIFLYFSRNRAEYITVLSLISFIAFMVFSSLHFDYDSNVVDKAKAKTKKEKFF